MDIQGASHRANSIAHTAEACAFVNPVHRCMGGVGDLNDSVITPVEDPQFDLPISMPHCVRESLLNNAIQCESTSR